MVSTPGWRKKPLNEDRLENLLLIAQHSGMNLSTVVRKAQWDFIMRYFTAFMPEQLEDAPIVFDNLISTTTGKPIEITPTSISELKKEHGKEVIIG